MVEKAWLKSYPKGVPEHIDPDHYQSLVDLFEETLSKNADKVAFINMDKSMTYREVDKLSRDFAAYLQTVLGFKNGDCVGLMMPNLLQYPIALLGVLRAGCVVANINPLYTPRELEHQLNDAKVKAIVIIANFAQTLDQVIAKTALQHVLITEVGDMLGTIKGKVVNFAAKYIKKMVPEYHLSGATSFNRALKLGAKAQYTRPSLSGDELAFLQYTGGTTGVSKGAMLSHRNMVANLEQVSGVLSPLLVDGEEFVVTPLPLYHIFALTANLLTFMKFGSVNLLITNPRDMPGFVKELTKYKVTALTGVNTLFNGLLNTPGFSDIDFSQLRLSLGGGMAVQRPVAERWQKVTGTALVEGYGLTECCPLVTITPCDATGYTGSIGLPAPSTDIKLVDEHGHEVAAGEAGELCVRGPQVMQGYYNREAATAEVISDGWLATGDIARMDERGHFYIVDRKKDMLIVSGFNVFPNEIEEVAVMNDKVLECAVIGVPHEISGEVVKLVAVKKDPSLSESELIEHCRGHLTAYKVPKIVEFRDDLPKTNVGKILRRELKN